MPTKLFLAASVGAGVIPHWAQLVAGCGPRLPRGASCAGVPLAGHDLSTARICAGNRGSKKKGGRPGLNRKHSWAARATRRHAQHTAYVGAGEGTHARVPRWYTMTGMRPVRQAREPGGGTSKAAGKRAQGATSGSGRSEIPVQQGMPWARGVHGAATAARLAKRGTRTDAAALPMPNLFDVVTFFRARCDSYTHIASFRLYSKENPAKVLSARELRVWYEGELQRRMA
jgi:hypothetical protein